MSNHIAPIEKLIHSTVRIECQTSTGLQTGTGYFFDFCKSADSSAACIVTNKHVITGAIKIRFHLTVRDDNDNPKLTEHSIYEVDFHDGMCVPHPDPDIDLALFPLAPFINEAAKRNVKHYCIALRKENIATEELLKSLSTMEEIIMIGYPNGLWDSTHNLPIIRRGITATHANLPLNGKSEFMIDAACFPGSSGSPVFLANLGAYIEGGRVRAGTRMALLGVLYAGPQQTVTGEIKVVDVPTSAVPIAVSTIPTNLGVVIHAKKILEFEPIVKEIMDKEARLKDNNNKTDSC